MAICIMTYVRFALGTTNIIIPTVRLIVTLYHPGGSNGLLDPCVCLSVCFCVLTITTLNLQMLRASLSGRSGYWVDCGHRA